MSEAADKTLSEIEDLLNRAFGSSQNLSRGNANRKLIEIKKLIDRHRGRESSLSPHWPGNPPPPPPPPDPQPGLVDDDRRCLGGCGTLLSKYNPENYCAVCARARAA